MKPKGLRSKIFLDGGDPKETKSILSLLGFLDGQTTNPTLVAKNPSAKDRIARGEKFTEHELLLLYRGIVEKIAALIPDGSVSIEVYADAATNAETMFAQGCAMFQWIPNAHIKYPTTKAGLIAAEKSIREGMRVNMTLCFSTQQAAAVYAATKGAKKGDVFISPFVGRLDDRGENGMQLIKDILNLYANGDGHVEVLTASVRTMQHFLYAIYLGSDIITAPASVLRAWSESGCMIPKDDFKYDFGALRPLQKNDSNLENPWSSFDIAHPLTAQGLERFAADWNALIAL